MTKDWKDRLGVVYSTDPDYRYRTAGEEEEETPHPSEQKLKVLREKKGRKGKTVTLIKGFVGKEDDIRDLSRMLKTKCGVGGSVKDSEIILQGDWVDRIKSMLQKAGYGVT